MVEVVMWHRRRRLDHVLDRLVNYFTNMVIAQQLMDLDGSKMSFVEVLDVFDLQRWFGPFHALGKEKTNIIRSKSHILVSLR